MSRPLPASRDLPIITGILVPSFITAFVVATFVFVLAATRTVESAALDDAGWVFLVLFWLTALGVAVLTPKPRAIEVTLTKADSSRLDVGRP